MRRLKTNEYPCRFDYDNGDKVKLVKPNVECEMMCDICGFNPGEAKRRLREGNFKMHDITIMHYENRNDVGSPMKFEDIWVLHFKTADSTQKEMPV